jgi:hypothetical protein
MKFYKSIGSRGDKAGIRKFSIVPPVLFLILVCFSLALMRVWISYGREYSSMLMDEDIYVTSFWRSAKAGAFELNAWSIPTMIGYYEIWRLWAYITDDSLFAMRSLNSIFGSISILFGYLILKRRGLSSARSLTWAFAVLVVPVLFLGQYVMTDTPVLAATLVFWYLILNKRGASTHNTSILLAFFVIALASTIRQTAVLTGLGGFIWLLLNQKNRDFRTFALLSIGVCLVVLAALFSRLYIAGDEFSKISISQVFVVPGCLKITDTNTYTPGKLLMAAEQTRLAVFTVFSVPLTVLGITWAFLFFRRRITVSPVFVLTFAAAISTAFLTVLVRVRAVGVTNSLTSTPLNTLVGWDYGGPSSSVIYISVFTALISVLGLLMLFIISLGLAAGVECIANSRKTLNTRLDFALLSLVSLPALCGLGAAFWNGLVVSPRYLITSLPLFILLAPALYTKIMGRICFNAHIWCVGFLILPYGMLLNCKFFDAIRLSEASWEARRMIERKITGISNVVVTPQWFAGHQTLATLSRRFNDSSTQLWAQGVDYKILLMRVDPLELYEPVNGEENVVIFPVIYPSKCVGYKAVVEIDRKK